MRLDKLLGSQTDLSRKEARQVIKDGLVSVGDVVIRDPGF
ncbi:MAG: 16S rRNA pseudouridine(516) synthase, partial [Clostridia bacterium]|nr:16S rRNA pseudouridine(516) synthase [Clostridia bacterium]